MSILHTDDCDIICPEHNIRCMEYHIADYENHSHWIKTNKECAQHIWTENGISSYSYTKTEMIHKTTSMAKENFERLLNAFKEMEKNVR